MFMTVADVDVVQQVVGRGSRGGVRVSGALGARTWAACSAAGPQPGPMEDMNGKPELPMLGAKRAPGPTCPLEEISLLLKGCLLKRSLNSYTPPTLGFRGKPLLWVPETGLG